MQSDIVIIGAGMAGYALAREIRKIDTNIPVVIVTADNGAVYSKPMLSNALAQGKAPDTLVQKDAATVAADLGIEIHTQSRVHRIDRDGRFIEVQGDGSANSTLSYGRLVLATGASPRPFRVPGSDAVPVASVNSLDDYRQWRQNLSTGDSILLIGAGLIGVEFANDLAAAGHPVTVVDPMPQPLGRLLPGQLGGLLGEALASLGVTVLTGHGIAALELNQAVLDDGRRVSYDHALSAIGLVPNTDLAVAAGLRVDQGIVVDDYLATSDPHIFALGDSAQSRAGVLPFVLPLIAEARALAKTLSGTPTRLHLPALPVAVKTPALPLVVCPPKPGSEGEWRVEGSGNDRRALFVGAEGSPLGFALTGVNTRERHALAKQMPDLLAA